MRVLMLSCNTGEGHNSTAKAIMEVLASQGVECELRDVLACLSPRFSKFVCNWHVRLYRYAPRLTDAGYRAFERGSQEPEENTPVYDLLALGAGKLWEILQEGDYDAVVCVHVFSGMMMTQVRRTWGPGIPCYFVATDYTCSPTVEQCEMDGYFIPDQDLAEEFIRAGLPEEKLLPWGIPVRQAFCTRGDKAQARQALGLPREGLVALLMSGSMGCGPLRKLVKELLARLGPEATLVAICGRNDKLQEELEEMRSAQLRVLGFSEEVPIYMDAADMVITKPGGLSITEAANKHLPMVFIDAVGGCEARNFTFFLNRGYALGSGNPGEVVALAASLAEDPEKREALARTLERAFCRDSAREIARTVLEGTALRENASAGME